MYVKPKLIATENSAMLGKDCFCVIIGIGF